MHLDGFNIFVYCCRLSKLIGIEIDQHSNETIQFISTEQE